MLGSVKNAPNQMPNNFSESVVEDAALSWLGEIGFAVLHGPEVAPEE